MIETKPGDAQPLSPFDEAVRAAYQAAQASGWHPSTRGPLRDAAVSAVLAYAGRPDAADAARRFHLLLVDLAADAAATDLLEWPDETLRAVRLAATRTLASPGKPHHRPRAQALLKRLDTLADPALQAREQVLLVLSRQRQAMHHLQVKASDPTVSERRLHPATLQHRVRILARLTDLVRGLPRGPIPPNLMPGFLADLRELQRLATTPELFDPLRQNHLFELMQRLIAPDRQDLDLTAAFTALDALRQQLHPAVQAPRQELTEMLFELELPMMDADQLTALRLHLGDLARIAAHLTDIPDHSLPALLFRLRQRLWDPGNEAIEPAIDAALATYERLEERRASTLADIKRLEVRDDEDTRRALAIVRQRQRELDALAVGLQGLHLAGLKAPDLPGAINLFRQLDALMDVHSLEPRAFEQAARALAQQLERPRLIRDRAWQAANAALEQLAGQRNALEETLRGLSFDRHLTAHKRLARQHLLTRQVESLEQARLVFASLPLEGLSGEAERRMLEAIAGFNQAVRNTAAGLSGMPLKQALETVVACAGSTGP